MKYVQQVGRRLLTAGSVFPSKQIGSLQLKRPAWTLETTPTAHPTPSPPLLCSHLLELIGRGGVYFSSWWRRWFCFLFLFHFCLLCESLMGRPWNRLFAYGSQSQGELRTQALSGLAEAGSWLQEVTATLPWATSFPFLSCHSFCEKNLGLLFKQSKKA